MPTKSIPLLQDIDAEDGRLPLPIQISIGDTLVEILGAGSKVPAQRTVEVSNAEDGQQELTLHFYQGVSNRRDANARIASYVVSGFTPRPRGTVTINLTLGVSRNFGFTLSATETDQLLPIAMKNPATALSQVAISKLMDEEAQDTPQEFDGVYDKADFHAQAIKDEGLAESQAYVHTGMFLGWLLKNGLTSEAFERENQLTITSFRNDEISASDLYREIGGELHQDLLSERGNAFAREYFDFRTGLYLEDYAEILAPESTTLLGVEDTSEHYKRIAERVDTRYRDWSEAQ